MSFRIDKSKVDRALANLAGRVKQPVRMLKTWGNSAAKIARENARSKGGRRFWRGIAQSVRLKQVSEDTLVVGSDHFAAAQKQFGGVIERKNKGALTIPISDEAKGKTVREFKMGGRPLFTIPGSDPRTIGILGYSAHGEFFPMFVLRIRTKRQDPDKWFPEEEEITSLGMKEAAFWLEKEAKEAAG